MRTIIALDIGTGPRGSGWCCLETDTEHRKWNHCTVSAGNTKVTWAKLEPNTEILQMLPNRYPIEAEYVFEGMSSYGAKVGASTLLSMLWIGRMIGCIEAARSEVDPPVEIVLRRTVSAHLVGARRHGDSSMDTMVTRAVAERFGGMGATTTSVKGKKSAPGPLYGVKKDIWSALAVGIAYIEGAHRETNWRA